MLTGKKQYVQLMPTNHSHGHQITFFLLWNLEEIWPLKNWQGPTK